MAGRRDAARRPNSTIHQPLVHGFGRQQRDGHDLPRLRPTGHVQVPDEGSPNLRQRHRAQGILHLASLIRRPAYRHKNNFLRCHKIPRKFDTGLRSFRRSVIFRSTIAGCNEAKFVWPHGKSALVVRWIFRLCLLIRGGRPEVVGWPEKEPRNNLLVRIKQ